MRAVAIALRVHSLRQHDQLGRHRIAAVAPARERPQAIADPDLTKQRVRVVGVKADPVIEITSVVVATPVVQEMHVFDLGASGGPSRRTPQDGSYEPYFASTCAALNALLAPGSLAWNMTTVTPISEVGAYIGVEKLEP